MHYYQMNGCGNRFAIFDGRQKLFRPTEAMLKTLADPKAGVGADQIIAMENSSRGDVFMRIWNADGSEVNACGNATRCVAHLVMEERNSDRLAVETEAGLLKAERVGAKTITVDMGSPLLKWEEIPLSERMDTRGVDLKIGPIDSPVLSRPSCVNMGNPHAVFFVEDINTVDVEAIGPLVEGHPIFPEGVNAGFAQILAPNRLRLRVWERGAGLTKACGTGACAALVAGVRAKVCLRKGTIELDGGDLEIEWRESDDRVLMTGPIEMELAGDIFG